jgi:predicted RNA-binding protein with PIN domain
VGRTVIDGYNLLFRDVDPGAAPLRDLREEFVRRVDAARVPGQEVTVVFDGKPGPRSSSTPAEGLSVRYTRSPRTADDLIVSLVGTSARGETTVLTHDRELARRVREAGGRVGDPAEFFRPPRRRPATRGRTAGKPPPPKDAELDEWERLFGERDEP